MSWQPAEAPEEHEVPTCDPVELEVEARPRALGGLTVGRILPVARRRQLGSFVFLDHMGPVAFAPGEGLDVRPHPHIGLATVTYLFAGSLLHHDSLGSLQEIRPGDVNWMTAGRGIAHSERTPAEARRQGGPLDGVQLWAALPRAQEETAPAFAHHAGDSLPERTAEGLRLRVIAGRFAGLVSPVETLSELFLADAVLADGARLALPAGTAERGAYLVEGAVEIAGRAFSGRRLLILKPDRPVELLARGQARLLLLGGAPLAEPRHIWWNFVSSRPERIEQAKADWRQGRFAGVPGEDDALPLPEGF